MSKPYLTSVRAPLTREHIQVILDQVPLARLILPDIEQIDYARGRLRTHKERSIIWDLDGREYEIILQRTGEGKGGTLAITPGNIVKKED